MCVKCSGCKCISAVACCLVPCHSSRREKHTDGKGSPPLILPCFNMGSSLLAFSLFRMNRKIKSGGTSMIPMPLTQLRGGSFGPGSFFRMVIPLCEQSKGSHTEGEEEEGEGGGGRGRRRGKRERRRRGTVSRDALHVG